MSPRRTMFIATSSFLRALLLSQTSGKLLPLGQSMSAYLYYRGMTLDEDVYENPRRFDPMRFMPKDVGGREEPYLPPFGFGRRYVKVDVSPDSLNSA